MHSCTFRAVDSPGSRLIEVDVADGLMFGSFCGMIFLQSIHEEIWIR